MSSSLKTSCADIVDNMPYDGSLQIFGPSSDPDSSVQLPLTLTSCTPILSLYAAFALCDSSTCLLLLFPAPAKESVSRSLEKVQLMLTRPNNSRRPLRNDHLHPRQFRCSVMVGYVARGWAVERSVCEGGKKGEESCYW